MGNVREYKSDVFCMLLEEKENALDVYNVLNGTNYTDPDIVEIVKLERGISLSVQNDSAFLVESDITFGEHQATYNPNMPLRSLIYFTNTIVEMVKNRDLYSRHLIKIPQPHFVVFYNGLEECPDREVQKLSDSYEKLTNTPELELTCTVYNINPGHNKAMMEGCRVLREYTEFVEKVREYKADNNDVVTAVESAIYYCIKHHILEDFLKRRKAEVLHVMTLDYTWERREVLIRQEEREEALQQGLSEGRRQGLSEGLRTGFETGLQNKLVILICKKLRKGQNVLQIADALEEDIDGVQRIVEVAEPFAPDYDEEKVMAAWTRQNEKSDGAFKNGET